MTTKVTIFNPFTAMDALDDKAIIAELEGQVIDKWVYHFPQEGKEIWGLSKVGVDQACREMALKGEVIREEDVLYELDPTDNRFVLFKSFASRVAVAKDGGEVCLDKTIGTKRQCVFVVTAKEGITNRPNAFWFEQGSIKALRNARLRLLSEEVRSKIMTLAKESGKITKVGAKSEAETPQDALQSPNNLPQQEGNGNLPTEAISQSPGLINPLRLGEQLGGFVERLWLVEQLKRLNDSGAKGWGEEALLSYMARNYHVEAMTPLEAASELDEGQAKHFVAQVEKAIAKLEAIERR